MTGVDGTSKWGNVDVETAELYSEQNNPQLKAGNDLTVKMNIQNGDKALVLGCGPGDHAFSIAEIVGPQGKVIGIDLDPENIAKAQDRLSKLSAQLQAVIKFHVADAADLAVVGHLKFNVIHGNAFVHWVHDRPRLYKELANVAEPGAILGIRSGDGSHENPLINLRNKVFAEQGCDSTDFPSWPTAEEFEQQLPAAGFCDVRISDEYATYEFPSAFDYMQWWEVSTGGSALKGLRDVDAGRTSMVSHIEHSLTASDGRGIFQGKSIFAIAHFT